ncbi:Tim44 domain-containing protein [Neptunomonas japonica]|uniref:Import inner membrane translocase subunit n=1 Tax=Neptunomonas japonica JAMM 1380 TaxID=1441457 RepID=A0A7R6SVQ9_9GAMM|nr:TIM44-like domain-containing protein [Neptunomonas japonica]BBB28952.1 import inner membrane translocase subunit [Neptunomonas japonica JAMM 1380]
MRNVLLAVFMMFFTLSIVAPEAQAKRLGGGFSLGKSFSSPKKVSPSPTQQKAPAQNASGSSAKKSGFGGMGGMLGGLLAGGLLASLFMGGAFDGIQMMDILMIAAFAFIAFKLFAMMRKTQVTPSYAGAQHRSMEPAQEPSETHHFTPMSAANTQLSEPDLVLPKWFNKVTFLDGAREHFTHLQSSWDKQDWDDIATYTSEELFEQLKQERSKYPAEQHTEVVSVMSELINFIDNQDHVVASINFYGWLKESGDQQTSEFNEIWHLTRNMAEENASWHIVGIEQP